jgi:hypothetical protein
MTNDVDLLKKYLNAVLTAAEDYGFSKARFQEAWIEVEDLQEAKHDVERARKDLEDYVSALTKTFKEDSHD